MPTTFTVAPGQSIGDVCLQSTGNINSWDSILTANSIYNWVPLFNGGEVLTIPDTVVFDQNNRRGLNQNPPANNATNVYPLIDAVFNLFPVPGFVLQTIPDINFNAVADSNNNIIYKLQIANNSGLDKEVTGISATLTGTFIAADFKTNGIKCTFSTSQSLGDGFLTLSDSATNAPYTFSKTDITGVSMPDGTTIYAIVTFDLAPEPTNGDTITINGAINPVIITLDYGTPVNEQENTAGTATVYVPAIVLSTISQANYTANKSTTGNIVYILKYENKDSTAYTITGIASALFGTNVGSDVAAAGFNVYRNTTPDLSGSPLLILSGGTSGTASYPFSISTSLFMAAGVTRYIIVALNISSGATTGHTLSMNGATNPILLTITGSPVVFNTQTNFSPVITVGT